MAENPFETLWHDIEDAAEKAYDALKVIAKEIETEAVADIEQIFKIGAPLAVNAIIAAATRGISGTEKFGEAVASVTQQLEVQLGPVAVQDIQALVQTAFRGVQKIVGAPPTP